MNMQRTGESFIATLNMNRGINL